MVVNPCRSSVAGGVLLPSLDTVSATARSLRPTRSGLVAAKPLPRRLRYSTHQSCSSSMSAESVRPAGVTVGGKCSTHPEPVAGIGRDRCRYPPGDTTFRRDRTHNTAAESNAVLPAVRPRKPRYWRLGEHRRSRSVPSSLSRLRHPNRHTRSVAIPVLLLNRSRFHRMVRDGYGSPDAQLNTLFSDTELGSLYSGCSNRSMKPYFSPHSQ
jgi:hypothetical protein